MVEDPVLTEIDGAVAWIRLNRPAAGNTLNVDLIEALASALRDVERDERVRVVVIGGVGPVFCAGAELSSLGPLDTFEVRQRFGARMARTGEVFRQLEALPKPTIACVHGLARAGGFELVLCCDLVVAERGARFEESHARHGQLPGGGSSVRLPRKVGPMRAKHLLFTGTAVTAEALADWGVVTEVVDDGVEAAAACLAHAMTGCSPLSLARLKQLVDDGLAQPAEVALRLEILAAELHLGSADMAEGLRAAEEGRAPVFHGH